MSNSKREDILSRVVTALAGTTNVSTRIYRSRVEALARRECPALIIEPVSDSATREVVDKLTWDLVFQVIVLVRADSPDATADATIQSVHNKIMSDATLDGLAIDLNPVGVDWKFEDADKPLAIISMAFRILYQTNYQSIVT